MEGASARLRLNVNNATGDKRQAPQARLRKTMPCARGNTARKGNDHEMEFMAKERLFYGCKVALQSIASQQFLGASEDGVCDARLTNLKVSRTALRLCITDNVTCSSGRLQSEPACRPVARTQSRAAAFTLINLENIGSNGLIRYGDSVWLQSIYTDLVGSRITHTAQASSKDKVGMRVGRPVLKKLDRNLNLTAKWTLVDPNLEDTPPERLSTKRKDVGHLGAVCLEQDWYYLADDGVNSTSLRQGMYGPDGVIGSGGATHVKTVETAALWRIHLLQNGSTARTMPRDEIISSTAQKQLKAIQDRARDTIALTKSIRQEMRLYAREREEFCIRAIDSRTESNLQHRKQHDHPFMLLKKARGKTNRGGFMHDSDGAQPQRIGGFDVGLQRRTSRLGSAPSASTSNISTGRTNSHEDESIVGNRDASSTTKLERAKARAMAIAAEALVSADVWMEIHQQEAQIKRAESQRWTSAALAVQRSWKRWARNRWKRKLQKLDNECMQKVVRDVARANEAALAAAILSQVPHSDGDSGGDSGGNGGGDENTGQGLLSSTGTRSATDSEDDSRDEKGERTGINDETHHSTDMKAESTGLLTSNGTTSSKDDDGANHCNQVYLTGISEPDSNMGEPNALWGTTASIEATSDARVKDACSWQESNTLLPPSPSSIVPLITAPTTLAASSASTSTSTFVAMQPQHDQEVSSKLSAAAARKDQLTMSEQLSLLNSFNPKVFNVRDDLGPKASKVEDIGMAPANRATNHRCLATLSRAARGPLDRATGLHRQILDEAKEAPRESCDMSGWLWLDPAARARRHDEDLKRGNWRATMLRKHNKIAQYRRCNNNMDLNQSRPSTAPATVQGCTSLAQAPHARLQAPDTPSANLPFPGSTLSKPIVRPKSAAAVHTLPRYRYTRKHETKRVRGTVRAVGRKRPQTVL